MIIFPYWWVVPAMFLFYSYVAMGVWFFGATQRANGLNFIGRFGLWLAAPLWVLTDWAVRGYSKLRGK
jgi:hypothetical protein